MKVLIVTVAVILASIAGHAQQGLPADITPITDDPRCATALNGITNGEQALWTGCARFWPSSLDTPEQVQRNRRLTLIWQYAQRASYGHYAPLYGPGALRPDQDVPRSAIAQGLTLSPIASPAVASEVRAKCAKEWADDFAMRAYCENTQMNASIKLRGRVMSSANEQTIRTKCTRDWPDDYMMRNYCEETQLKALATLSR